MRVTPRPSLLALFAAVVLPLAADAADPKPTLALVGGSLVIESAPSCGATLIVRIPIRSST